MKTNEIKQRIKDLQKAKRMVQKLDENKPRTILAKGVFQITKAVFIPYLSGQISAYKSVLRNKL